MKKNDLCCGNATHFLGFLRTLITRAGGTIAVTLVVLFAALPAPTALAGDSPPPELCGDGIDNDGDRDIDEGFDFTPYIVNPGVDDDADGIFDADDVDELRCAFTETGPGTPDADDLEECKTLGYAVCSADKLSIECVQETAGRVNPIRVYALETGGLCSDGKDNDCDGTTDILDPGCQSLEVCDNQDNDGDGVVDNGFPGLGSSCSVGVGACQDSGKYVCTADKTGTECSAIAGSPKVEKPANGTCNDGKDNDCDGLADLADPDCVPIAEVCNGVDDNGNGLIDEGFGVGQACSTGVGACAVPGMIGCVAGVAQCSGTPGSPGAEGDGIPGSCSDQIDNDCDGLTDAVDSDCKSGVTDLGVYCALPFNRGKPGQDCTGKHKIEFGAGPGVTVVADLLALDAEGQVMQSVTGVKNGEEAHLASRLLPEDYKFKVKNLKGGKRSYEVFSPLPQLRVTATKGGVTETAYCSNVPFLDVTNPQGTQEISLSEGDTVLVEAAIPLVDVDTLFVKVDGVDIFAAIGIDPAPGFPGGPYCGNPGACVFQIEKEISGEHTIFNVEVRDLVVDGLDGPDPSSAVNGVDDQAQNVLSFKLTGLPAGGHIIFVDAEPLAFAPVTPECLVDDIKDKGIISAFGITIEKPMDQEVVPAPVQVKGEVRSGVEIARLMVNGGPEPSGLPVGGQAFTPGDGEDSADEYVLPFDADFPLTNLQLKQAGTAPLGTFDPGSNELIADASTVSGTRGFARRIFATGQVASPGGAALQQFALEAKEVIEEEYAKLQSNIVALASSTTIPNAFVVGLQEQGGVDFFNKECTNAINQFTADVKAALDGKTLGTADIEPTCSCNLNNVPVVLDSVNFPGTTACPADFVADKINIHIDLPDIQIKAHARRSCETTFLGACVARTVLNVSTTVTVTDLAFDFSITEDNILNGTPPVIAADAFKFTAPTEANGGIVTDTDDSGIECLGGAICNFFVLVGDFLLEVVTFGLVPDEFITFGDISDVNVTDFKELIGATEPDPMKVGEIRPDPEAIKSFGQSLVEANLDDVQIVDGGLTVSLGATFNTLDPDPSVPPTPGAVLTPASAPTPLQLVNQHGGEISLLVADDAFNQLFASLAASGALKTQCHDTGTTVGDLLPDCETLTSTPPDGVLPDTLAVEAQVALQGLCHGVSNISTPNCEDVTNPGNLLHQAIEQGACHGARGATCTTLPVTDPLNGLAEGAACAAVKLVSPGGLNMQEDDGLVACAGEKIPPRLVFNPNSSGGTVLTDLFLQELSVSFLLDREANGFAGDLPSAKNCFAQGGNVAPDCKLYEACLDLTLKTSMALDSSECQVGETGFKFLVNSVVPSGFQSGVVCGAAKAGADEVVTQQSASDPTVDEVAANAEQFAPPICAQGLTLGGKLDFSEGKVFTVTTNGGTGFADYLGITGNLQ
jgi:hypothetical protein